MKRKIITIDEEKCDGCGQCVPDCPEGALRIVDGKARLVGDVFCDGLGACVGNCPRGAIRVEEREAGEYDERKVMANVVRQGGEAIREHLAHLKSHRRHRDFQEAVKILKEKGLPAPEAAGAESPKDRLQPCDCPGAKVVDFRKGAARRPAPRPEIVSRLGHWPVQLHLVPPGAPFLEGADLLIAADCVPVAYAGFHDDLLAGRSVVIGCPKFDDRAAYLERLTDFFRRHEFRSVTVAHMEVPCCRGLQVLVEEALKASGKTVPLREVVIGIKGGKLPPPN